MTRYITTGKCPYCRVAILPSAYVSKNFANLLNAANRLTLPLKLNPYSRRYARILAPSGARAKVTESSAMRCLNCMQYWYPSAVIANLMRQRNPAQWKRVFPALSSSSSLLDPSKWKGLIFSPSQPLKLPSQPQPQTLDLSGCRLIGVKEEKLVEWVLEKERKRYPNNSGSTVTRELIVTNSITRTVTIESSKLQSQNMNAGIIMFGFATIQGQVQQQLSERYSVALQSATSVSRKSEVTIKPYSTIEHIIQWKLDVWTGIALLGILAGSFPPRGIPLAEVPFQVPFRLTYDDDFIDVKDVPVKKKRS